MQQATNPPCITSEGPVGPLLLIHRQRVMYIAWQ